MLILDSASLLKSQGRCCRELLCHMKLTDTYTNLCFLALLVHTTPFSSMPAYLPIVSFIAMAVFLMSKLILVIYFLFFIFKYIPSSKEIEDEFHGNGQENEFRKKMENERAKKKARESLVSILIWLDMESMAKIYDGESRNESN